MYEIFTLDICSKNTSFIQCTTCRFDFVVIGAAFIMGIVEAIVADGMCDDVCLQKAVTTHLSLLT